MIRTGKKNEEDNLREREGLAWIHVCQEPLSLDPPFSVVINILLGSDATPNSYPRRPSGLRIHRLHDIVATLSIFAILGSTSLQLHSASLHGAFETGAQQARARLFQCRSCRTVSIKSTASLSFQDLLMVE